MELQKGSNRTKALLSLALCQLILRNVPYDSINIRDICTAANVSRMSFYRYYTKKDDIFIDYCDERFAEFYDDIFKISQPDGRTFVTGMFHHFRKYSRQLIILKKANKEYLLIDQFNSYCRYLINNWPALKNTKYVNNKVIAPFLSGGLFNVLMTWLDTDMKETPEEMADKLFKLFPTFQEEI